MILCRGKFLVSELAPGDRVQGFDYRNKRLAMGTILAVTPVAPAQRVLVPITRYKMVPVTRETVGLAANGLEQPVMNTRNALGFCQDKMKVVDRELGCAVEFDELVEAVELQWEWPEYIWFEGILVGTEL
jgi:hypothetical protein